MSSFSCPPPWLGDHWDILLHSMKNHFGRSCGDIQMVPGGAKCCQGDPGWRGEGRNEWGGGTGQLGGAWWSRSPRPRCRARGSWHICQSSAARARMSLGGHTRSFWQRELVEILRQGAWDWGLLCRRVSALGITISKLPSALTSSSSEYSWSLTQSLFITLY